MFGIKAQITRCIDHEGYPSIVECRFVDMRGCLQVFHDKDAIFTQEHLDRSSVFPLDAVVACEVIERRLKDGREFVKVNTEVPWHVESTEAETIFDVWAEQVIEFEHPA